MMILKINVIFVQYEKTDSIKIRLKYFFVIMNSIN
jgi:hypothetical protein